MSKITILIIVSNAACLVAFAYGRDWHTAWAWGCALINALSLALSEAQCRMLES